jgi:putative glutamine amidotransferase
VTAAGAGGRPLIGITGGPGSDDREHFRLRDDYVRAVERAGGLPLVLVPGAATDADDLLAAVDGLVLTGGGDVDPALYGQDPHPKLAPAPPGRDAFEIALARAALGEDRPLLAICRGHQVLNVATGGTLIQDIPSLEVGAGLHDPDRERWEPAHDVRILPGTRLREILGRDRVAVNSFHHQAVQALGDGLVASAWSEPDGLVEAVERPDCRFVVGVQWHPESFWDHGGAFQPLFEALTRAAGERRGRQRVWDAPLRMSPDTR